MNVIPPMQDDPPPEFVQVIAAHEPVLRREALRLTGGDPVGYAIYEEALTDLAGHWRRLRFWSRVTGTDVPGDYLRQRILKRTRAWREDQVYEVEVRVLRTPAPFPVPVGGPAPSLALRKASLIDGTSRAGLLTLADAAVAWCHAWRRSEHRRILRLIIGGLLLIATMIQTMSWLAGPGS
ncbi:hypothetical protein ACWT_6405 [Actinoplanes sp. SE50]|uniref:hypothetical protein n=1 Tax=unclassified Actinoplanes TaxID=2626549 RepID=UPI00023EBDF4|nr:MULTISPECIES: hypothetical protein [unclassified Actinoplanes]AEV87418.1 hypothetical protein ACPL_6536 [Actinoplanes sp. SE50/110]ATO85820.1 hypothetical protein ACWT_6405 [Actinoplanes sp. SE50]SLM03233.1 hypothetical protein ACSP50_6522 [Actinoplanes sp. SE50/110]